jgi:hypothetical protein
MFYIGIKIIEAWPETKENRKGYGVKYPDGYISWSPKDAFESAYYPMGEKDNIVTAKMVENFLLPPQTKKIDEKTTQVITETITGFTQYKTSSCVDPDNYNHAMGEELCMNKIYDKLWSYFGFIVQWGKFGLKNKEKNKK